MPAIAIGAALGAAIGTAGLSAGGYVFGATLFASVITGALLGASVGGFIGGIAEQKKLKKSISPRYQSQRLFGALTNTSSNEIPLPVLFGSLKLAGNIIWQSPLAGAETIYQFITLSEGEINSISDVRVNDIAIGDLTGCSYDTYLGTAAQTPDARASGDVKGLKYTAYLAVTLQASDQLTGGQPAITCVAEGVKIKVWDTVGSAWVTEYSNNPVWILRAVLTNSDWGWGLNEAWINDASFKTAAAYCDALIDKAPGEVGTEKRATYNFLLDERLKAYDVVHDIMSTFGGFLSFTGPTVKLNIETTGATVQAFDEDNIISGSFTYHLLGKDDSPNRVGVEFIDPDQNYTKTIAYHNNEISQREREALGDEAVVPADLRMWGITRFSQASRMARFYSDLANICGTLCSFETNIQGIKCEIGDVITVTHDTPGWTDKPFRVLSMEEAPNNRVTFIGREYYEALYDDSYGSGVMQFDYGTPISPHVPCPNVDNLVIAESNYTNKDGTYISDITVAFDHTTEKKFLDYYLIELKKGGGDYKVVGTSKENAFTIPNMEVGIAYYVKVKAATIYNIVNTGTTSAELTILGKAVNPSNVISFAYTFTNEIVFTWEKNTDNDLAGYEIRTEDANWGTQNAHLKYRGMTNTHTIVTPSSRAPGAHYIKAFDRSGNYSSAAQTVTPTNAVPATPTITSTQWFGFAKIEWTDVADADLRYYEIYRSATNAWAGEEALEAKVSGTEAIVQGKSPSDAIADSADATSITDATLIGAGVDYFVGDVIVQTSGTYDGQEAVVTAFNNATGQVTVASWPSGTPDADDEFVIKDRTHYKVRAVDTYGPGSFSAAQTINFTPLAAAEVGDAIISARKLIAGEVITLTAQIKDAIITNAKINDLNATKINAGYLSADRIESGTIVLSKLGNDAIPPKTYYQALEPSGEGERDGDYWVDTDDDNILYVYDTGAWHAAGAAGGITTFRQSEIPVAVTAGDLWIDTDDNKLYRATNIGDNEITAGEWELQNAAIATGWAHGLDVTKIDGGDIYTRTVTAGKIAAGTYIGGDFVIGAGGAFKSDNYVLHTTGFKLDHEFLELNDVVIMNKGIEYLFSNFQEGFLSFGGDGSDGDVTISINTDISGLTKQYNNLTINAGITLTAKDSIIGVKGILTVNGTISANAGGSSGGTCPELTGNDKTKQGTNGTAGDTTGCGGSGGGGGGAYSWNGVDYGIAGGVGGACQQSGGTAGGVGGAGGNGNAVGATYLISAKAWYRGDYLISIGDGAGGAAGSAAKLATNGHCNGGAGGVGGGWLYIEARNVTVSATGVISANGANGSNGSATGGDSIGGPAAGGGGGGGGGVLVIRYSTYSDSGSVTANGGTGGAEAHTPDHANGGNGGAGGGGTVWVVNA